MQKHNEEGLKVVISPGLSDRLYTLSAEYSISADFLAELAVKRLVADVDFIRNLRAGRIKPE